LTGSDKSLLLNNLSINRNVSAVVRSSLERRRLDSRTPPLHSLLLLSETCWIFFFVSALTDFLLVFHFNHFLLVLEFAGIRDDNGWLYETWLSFHLFLIFSFLLSFLSLLLTDFVSICL